MQLITILIRFSLAMGLGACVGIERQLHDQAAGIRTAALVSLGSCAFVVFSVLGSFPDGSRVAAQVVTGIGFLGAGVIIHDGFTIRGLTTAATMWSTSAIGVLCGGGYLKEAALLTALILVINIVIRPISAMLKASRGARASCFYILRLMCAASEQQEIRAQIIDLVVGTQLRVTALNAMKKKDAAELSVKIAVKTRDDTQIENITAKLMLLQTVTCVEWRYEETLIDDKQ